MEIPNFSDLGRVDAIKFLYEKSKFIPFVNNTFEVNNDSRSFLASRLFLEGIDFDLTYFPLKHLGYKCITAITGSLFSMIAEPEYLDIKIGISQKLELKDIVKLWEGIVQGAEYYKYKNINLDLLPSKTGLSISIAANGVQKNDILNKKHTDSSMDLICISGNIGGAYLGMRLFEKEKLEFLKNGKTDKSKLEKYKMIISSYFMPEINSELINKFIDSDLIPNRGYLCDRGLADCIKQIVRDTKLGAKIYADKIPFEGNSFELGKELDIDPISAAMNGGEDYRLIFTIPIKKIEKFRHDFQTFDVIGHLAQPEVGSVLVTPDGVELPMKSQGWSE